MKNMHFIEVQNNQPVAQGVLGGQVGPEHFIARYFSPRKFTRVVSMKMLESFALFESQEEAAAFVAQPAPPADVPTGTPEKKVDTAKAKKAK